MVSVQGRSDARGARSPTTGHLPGAANCCPGGRMIFEGTFAARYACLRWFAMGPVQLSCPHCTGILQTDSALGGQQVTCPHCYQPVTVPVLDGHASGPPGFGAPPEQAGPPNFAPPPYPPPPYPPQPGGPTGGIDPSVHPPQEEPVQLACPLCQGPFAVLPSMAGQAVACPHCQGHVTVPVLGPVATGPSMPGPTMPGPMPPAPPGYGPPGFAPPEPPGYPPPDPQATGGPPPFPAGPSFSAGPSIPQAPTGPSIPLTPVGPPSAPPGPSGPHTPKVVAPPDNALAPPREKTKVVRRGGRKIELRSLTPEEKKQRRHVRNIVLSIACLGLLMFVLIILLKV